MRNRGIEDNKWGIKECLLLLQRDACLLAERANESRMRKLGDERRGGTLCKTDKLAQFGGRVVQFD